MNGQMIELPRELVLASAGTGKTFRISSRIIGLLAAGAPAETVFASTFTRKAAGEILDRVLARLAAAALDDTQARELAEHARLSTTHEIEGSRAFWLGLLQRLARELHRVNIGTIDAFFVRAATSFADDLALPSSWTIADQPTMERVHAKALQSVLDSADGEVLVELLRGITRAGAGRSVHNALLRKADELLRVHHSIDPAVADAWSGLDAAVAVPPKDPVGTRVRLAEALREVPVPTTKKGTPNVTWAGALQKCADHIEAGAWDELLKQTLCGAALGEEKKFSRQPVPDEVCTIFEEMMPLARYEIGVRLARQASALGRLAELLAAAVERVQHSAGVYDFGDLTRLIGGSDPIASREDLYYRLDAQTQHILLDEFQDTSLAQWEALAPLLEELLSGHQGERAAVIVADPKQSIYAWRGGEPRLVRHVGEQFLLDDERLHTSYRSSAIVLDAVNQVFEDLPDNPVFAGDDVAMREAGSWSTAFTEHRAAKELPGYVRMEVGPQDEGRGSDRPRLCRRAAEVVAELTRSAPGASIGVLTRRNKTVARIMLELKQLGISASEEGGNPLTDSAAVASVLALLQMVDHPGNLIARYHVARTPVGERLEFTDHTDDAAAHRLADHIRARLVDEGYGATLEWIAHALREDCDARERRRLSQLVELAFAYEPRATLRTDDFVRLVEKERVEDPTLADVRVMTIHMSKGLEFDIVVLPELDEPLCKKQNDLLSYRPHPVGRVTRAFPYIPAAQRALFPEIAELHAAEEQGRQGKLRDGLSSLYVALTRARHALHILVKPEGKSSTAMSGARLVAAAFDAIGESEEGDVLYKSGDPHWYRGIFAKEQSEPVRAATEEDAAIRGEPELAGEVRLRRSARNRSFTRRKPSGLSHTGVDVKLLLNLEATAAHEGTLVHAWMEQVEWIDDGLPGDEEMLAIARRVQPEISEDRVRELSTRLRAQLESDTIRQTLLRSRYPAGATVEREVPFIHRDEGALVEGVMDRLVVIREGGEVSALEILDFKTDALRDATSAVVDARVADYALQMQEYRSAAARSFGIGEEGVRCILLLLDIGEAREV